MKKKAIEKILIPVELQMEKPYTAVAKKEVIADEAHLLVDVYEGGVRLLRMATSENDYGVWYPETGKWKSKKIKVEGNNNCVWNGNREQTYIDTESEKLIFEMYGDVKYWLRNGYSTWIDCILEQQNQIIWEKKQLRDQRRLERLIERTAHTPENPDDITEWAEKEVFSGFSYLYYKRHGRKVDVACSACGQSDTYPMHGEEYDPMEKTVEKPVHNEKCVCPMCGKKVIWKAKGRVKGTYSMRHAVFLGQPYKENGAVLKYIEVEKVIRLCEADVPGMKDQAKESYIVSDIARAYFEKGKKMQKDFRKYDYFKQEGYWDDCNMYGMNQIEVHEADVYPGTWDNLRGTILEYSGAKEYFNFEGRIHLFDYMKTYMEYPQMEFLAKMGLCLLIRSMLYGALKLNKDGKTPAEILGINQNRMKEVLKKQADSKMIKVLRVEHELGMNWKEDELQFVTAIDYRKEELKVVLQYTTLRKLMNKLNKYTGFHGDRFRSLREIAGLYFDYISMRQQRGYDLTDTIILFPKDLIAAHHKMVQEIDEGKNKKREKEANKRFPNIAKQYRKNKEKFFYEDEEFLIRPARSAAEIVREGRELHHCVGGDNYLTKHNRSESFILFLREKRNPDVPFITVEVKDDDVVQWYAAYDEKPHEHEVDRWLCDYIDIVNFREMEKKEYNDESDVFKFAG